MTALEQAAVAFAKADRAFREAYKVFVDKHPELLREPFETKRNHPDYAQSLAAIVESNRAKNKLVDEAIAWSNTYTERNTDPYNFVHEKE
jgi:hypothetical protein